MQDQDETQRGESGAQAAENGARASSISELLPDQEPSLGRGPWDVEEVTEFVRPAYGALGGEGRSLMVLDCSTGNLLTPGADSDRGSLHLHRRVLRRRAGGARDTMFADDGTVAAERDAT